MTNSIAKIAAVLDARLDFLRYLKAEHPEFYIRLLGCWENRQTRSFEEAIINALETFGIYVFADPEDIKVHVTHSTSSGTAIKEDFEDNEAALTFAIGLLHIK